MQHIKQHNKNIMMWGDKQRPKAYQRLVPRKTKLIYCNLHINGLHRNIQREKKEWQIHVRSYWVYEVISLDLYFLLKLDSEGQFFISDSRLFHNFGPLYLIVVRENSYLNLGI